MAVVNQRHLGSYQVQDRKLPGSLYPERSRTTGPPRLGAKPLQAKAARACKAKGKKNGKSRVSAAKLIRAPRGSIRLYVWAAKIANIAIPYSYYSYCIIYL